MLHTEWLSHWITVHGFVAVLGLAIYAFASHTRQQRRQPSAAIAWIISLALLPYLALPLYLLVGTRKVSTIGLQRNARPALGKQPYTNNLAESFQQLAHAMDLPPVMSYGQLEIHQDGLAALQSLRLIIDEAVQTLDVCTFLIGRDVLGCEIVESLTRKAQSGVQVRLLVDGLGVYLEGKLNLRGLSNAGAKVELFASPLRTSLQGRINLRNHRKMVIADGQKAWTGGRNLAAEYFVGDPTATPPKSAWVDLTFKFSGDLAQQAQRQFDQDWDFATQTPPPPASHPLTVDHTLTLGRAQFIPSGPDQLDDTVYSLLISACFGAKNRILAVTPYFVPDATFLMSLTLAARRGVEVDLLLPSKSNHRLADIARHAALREMVSAGARVWMMPKMIHAKVVVIDDSLAFSGSANLDERSFFLNYELMFVFLDSTEVNRFANWIGDQAKLATPYVPRPQTVLREVAEGLVRWVAFQL